MIKLKKGEELQFGHWLEADMGQRKTGPDEGFWHSGGRGVGGSKGYGYTRSNQRSGSGSDSLSWRKSDSRSNGRADGKVDGGEEVTSPPKAGYVREKAGVPRRLLLEEAGSIGKKSESQGATSEEATKTTSTLARLQEQPRWAQ